MEAGKPEIRARAIIEILGRPKEHIVKMLNSHLDKIEKDSRYDISNKDIAPPKAQQDLFSTFAELEFTAKNIEALVDFCLEYLPSSIEIIEPTSIAISSQLISGLLNDLQARIHKQNITIFHLGKQNLLLRKSLNSLLKNIIFLLLSRRPAELEVLSSITGVNKEELRSFLDALVKEGKLIKKGKTYLLKKQ